VCSENIFRLTAEIEVRKTKPGVFDNHRTAEDGHVSLGVREKYFIAR